MKICYVSYEFPPQFGGGIGTYVGTISKDLASLGNEVHVLTYNPGGMADTENYDGVHVHRVSMADSQLDPINHASSSNLSTLLYWSLYSEKVYHRLKDLHSAHHFEVVEFCDYRGEAYFAALAKRVKGEFKDTPLVIRLHTPLSVLNQYNGTKNDPGTEQLVNFEHFPMMLVDEIVSPSHVLAEKIVEQLCIEKSITIVPHPIDLDSFPKTLNYKESNVVLYVGRLENRKGVVELVQAMFEFLPKYPSAILKMIGGDTDSAPGGKSMKEYLASLIPMSLRTRVVFIDRIPRNEVIQQYQSARMCVFPSLFENFPNVCLEAMASGVPVVVSDNSGMAEMVEDNVSGLIVKAGDVGELSRKIEELYVKPLEERRSIAKAARQRVEQRYVKSIIAEEQVEYFRSIVQSGNGTHVAGYCEYSGAYERGLVSVVVPCFNHGQFIEETIRSVELSSYSNFEIIVVNDGSTDPRTLDVLNKIVSSRVKVLHQNNAGLSAARNTGVNNAKGEYILPLDADDIIAPDFLEKTVAVLEGDNTVGFVYTYVKFFGAADGVWKTPDFDPNLLLVSNLCVATALYRHVAFDQIGGYKTDMVHGFEDWDFWIYMVDNGWKGKCIHESLFFYRKHSESMLSNSQRNRAVLLEKIIEHHLETYKRALAYVVVEKDRQFFDAHMSNYANHMELSSIVSSKAWKAVRTYRKIKDKVKSLVGER